MAGQTGSPAAGTRPAWPGRRAPRQTLGRQVVDEAQIFRGSWLTSLPRGQSSVGE